MLGKRLANSRLQTVGGMTVEEVGEIGSSEQDLTGVGPLVPKGVRHCLINHRYPDHNYSGYKHLERQTL